MTKEQAQAILLSVAGNPTNGPVADIIPAMAEAIAASNEPTERRIFAPPETR